MKSHGNQQSKQSPQHQQQQISRKRSANGHVAYDAGSQQDVRSSPKQSSMKQITPNVGHGAAAYYSLLEDDLLNQCANDSHHIDISSTQPDTTRKIRRKQQKQQQHQVNIVNQADAETDTMAHTASATSDTPINAVNHDQASSEESPSNESLADRDILQELESLLHEEQ